MDRAKDDRTIADFGEQWSRYVENDGHYGSLQMFRDIVGPLCQDDAFLGKRVHVGSGTGRIVEMLVEAGAANVTAIEPSRAYAALIANVARHGAKVVCINARGDQIPAEVSVDCATSIGVLHHIEDPRPVMHAVREALVPGGVFVAWLYGREGNGLYLALFQPLRRITRILPHPLLAGLCHLLNAALGAYIALARRASVPMRSYILEVLAPLRRDKRYLVIYDQLNPHFAKYYTRKEAEALFREAGFLDVRLHHRHGYSWTVRGMKPRADAVLPPSETATP